MFSNELYHYIFSFSDYTTLLNLEQCCINFKNIINDNYFKINDITFDCYKQRLLFHHNLKKIILSDCYKKMIYVGSQLRKNLKMKLFDDSFVIMDRNYKTSNLYNLDTSIIRSYNHYQEVISKHYHVDYINSKIFVNKSDTQEKLFIIDESMNKIFFDNDYIYYAPKYYYANGIKKIIKYNMDGTIINSKDIHEASNNFKIDHCFDDGYLVTYMYVYPEHQSSYMEIINTSTFESIYKKPLNFLGKLVSPGTYRPLFKYPYIVEWKHVHTQMASFDIFITNIKNNTNQQININFEDDYPRIDDVSCLNIYNDILFVKRKNKLYVYDLKIKKEIKNFVFDKDIINAKINKNVLIINFYDGYCREIRVYTFFL